MAAVGDEAAAMDSISREPAAQLAAVHPAAGVAAQAERPDKAVESPAVVPKKPGTNSTWCFPHFRSWHAKSRVFTMMRPGSF